MVIILDLEYENPELSNKLVLLCTQSTLALLTWRMEGSKRSQPSLNRVPYMWKPALLLSSKHHLQNYHISTFKRLLEPPGR